MVIDIVLLANRIKITPILCIISRCTTVDLFSDNSHLSSVAKLHVAKPTERWTLNAEHGFPLKTKFADLQPWTFIKQFVLLRTQQPNKLLTEQNNDLIFRRMCMNDQTKDCLKEIASTCRTISTWLSLFPYFIINLNEVTLMKKISRIPIQQQNINSLSQIWSKDEAVFQLYPLFQTKNRLTFAMAVIHEKSQLNSGFSIALTDGLPPHMTNPNLSSVNPRKCDLSANTKICFLHIYADKIQHIKKTKTKKNLWSLKDHICL